MNLIHKIIIHAIYKVFKAFVKIEQSKAFKQNSLELQVQNIFKFTKLFYTTIHEPHAQNNHSWPSTK
jgi:hypothetical protein